MTVDEFKKKVEEYFVFLEVEKNVSIHTLRAYRGDLEQFLEFWQRIIKKEPKGDRSFNKIVRRFVLALFYKKIAKTTLARKLSCMRSIARFLESQGISVNLNIKSPKIERKLPKVLTVDEIFYLLDQIKIEDMPSRFPYRDKAIFELLYATGVRCSELAGMKLQDINFDQKSVQVLGKGRKARVVLFGDKARKSVQTYVGKERGFIVGEQKDPEYVFLNYSGSQLTVRSIQRVFEMFRKFLKVDRELTPHKVRHSFATHLKDDGIEDSLLQKLMGHGNYKTTQTYARVTSCHFQKIKNPHDLLY